MRSLLTMGFNVQLKHDAEETSREDHGWVAVHDEARCSPFRASACAARTLNVRGQSRVTLSLL